MTINTRTGRTSARPVVSAPLPRRRSDPPRPAAHRHRWLPTLSLVLTLVAASSALAQQRGASKKPQSADVTAQRDAEGSPARRKPTRGADGDEDRADGDEEVTLRLDLNLASAAELEQLPGIGPAKAQAIVALRERRGPFRRVAEIMRVKGIGRATYRKLAPMLFVTQAAARTPTAPRARTAPPNGSDTQQARRRKTTQS